LILKLSEYQLSRN